MNVVKLLLVVVVAVNASVAMSANTIIFDNSVAAPDFGAINDPGGNPIADASGWLVRVYESSSATISGPYTGDTYTGYSFTWSSAGGDGFFNNAFNNPDVYNVGASDYIYLVVFNAATINLGVTQYSVMEGATANQVPVSLFPSPTINPTTVGGWSQGAWTVTPVPEPSSIALLGLGLGLIALRRKMRK